MRIKWRNEFQAELIKPNILLPKYLFSHVYIYNYNNNNNYYYYYYTFLTNSSA